MILCLKIVKKRAVFLVFIYIASVIFQFHYQVNEESRNYLLKSFLLIEVKKYCLKQMVKDRQLIRNNK
ncbi:unnamed protein product [Rhizophagus irregularis]|nr:unnamed protein product [Rhizophagus irregularis]